ncbi:MAG: formate dehydrogenase accessory sulfurtransferase FdhD [Verrucomicrobiae bacterium]|nr:formate dehydrogenase accessory sulfurtransferase FdhD [Verrucomicrobiae bacterium]
MPRIQAALVAGGRSTRMGSDKAFLDWKGRPLFAIQLEKLFAACPDSEFPVLLSANEAQPFPDFIDGVRIVRDTMPDLGPLGALRDCLAAAEKDGADFLLILGVDLPAFPSDGLKSLFDQCRKSGKGVVPFNEERWDPLVGIYPVSALPLVQLRIAEDLLSMQRFCDRAENEGLIVRTEVRSDWLQNINTPEEYDQLQQGMFDHPTLLSRFETKRGFTKVHDRLAAEEPLEIRVEGKSIAVMMRTPGHDEELAAGFLVTEGVVRNADDIFEINRCRDITDPEAAGNVLDVKLASHHNADLEKLTRHVFTSSSCGVCGKATIDSIFQDFSPIESDIHISPKRLLSLPDRLRAAQETFEKTGGLHASALFDARGTLQLLREDVGRHNALDKVIGRALLDGKLPLSDRILLVSGRISFELIQKALAAGIPIIAGISAPSSLAVEFAKQSGQTLVGFLREKGFNVYADQGRVLTPKDNS